MADWATSGWALSSEFSGLPRGLVAPSPASSGSALCLVPAGAGCSYEPSPLSVNCLLTALAILSFLVFASVLFPLDALAVVAQLLISLLPPPKDWDYR